MELLTLAENGIRIQVSGGAYLEFHWRQKKLGQGILEHQRSILPLECQPAMRTLGLHINLTSDWPCDNSVSDDKYMG